MREAPLDNLSKDDFAGYLRTTITQSCAFLGPAIDMVYRGLEQRHNDGTLGGDDFTRLGEALMGAQDYYALLYRTLIRGIWVPDLVRDIPKYLDFLESSYQDLKNDAVVEPEVLEYLNPPTLKLLHRLFLLHTVLEGPRDVALQLAPDIAASLSSPEDRARLRRVLAWRDDTDITSAIMPYIDGSAPPSGPRHPGIGRPH